MDDPLPLGADEFELRGVRFKYELPDFSPLGDRLPRNVVPTAPRPTPSLPDKTVLGMVVPRHPDGSLALGPVQPPLGIDGRVALAKAQTDRAAALATLDEARAVLSRGDETLAEASASLERLRFEAEAVSANAAARFKAWLSGGNGDRPAAPAEPIEARLSAETEVSAIERARADLAADLAAAEAAVAFIDRRIQGAIDRIICDEALDLAKRLFELESAAAELRIRLGAVDFPNCPMPSKVWASLHDAPPNVRQTAPPVRERERAAWAAWRRALGEDADARFAASAAA